MACDAPPAIRSKLTINPPLLNSASPWATTYEDLKQLYDCQYTGAVTVRTSLLKGFNHDESVHQYCFFESGVHAATKGDASIDLKKGQSSLNTLGYSPINFGEYLGIVKRVVRNREVNGSGIRPERNGGSIEGNEKTKPIILSVTGTPQDVEEMYLQIGKVMKQDELDLAMEINLSCPNIKGKPPPAYDGAALAEYLVLLKSQKEMLRDTGEAKLPPVGIKLPPYTYMGQFEEVCGAIAAATALGKSVVDFVTSTNTLGSSLVLDPSSVPMLASEAGTGIGGLAGSALHPLTLGNVATLRRVLDEKDTTKVMVIIGVGGVGDRGGFERMTRVGAGAVAVATALGREGVGIFEKILMGKGMKMEGVNPRKMDGQSYVA